MTSYSYNTPPGYYHSSSTSSLARSRSPSGGAYDYTVRPSPRQHSQHGDAYRHTFPRSAFLPRYNSEYNAIAARDKISWSVPPRTEVLELVYESEWQKIKEFRADIWKSRSRLHVIRGELRKKERAISEAADIYFHHLRMLVLGVRNDDVPSTEQKTIEQLFGDYKRAIDTYEPLEDACIQLEDQLSQQEFELSRLEDNIYFIDNVPWMSRWEEQLDKNMFDSDTKHGKDQNIPTPTRHQYRTDSWSIFHVLLKIIPTTRTRETVAGKVSKLQGQLSRALNVFLNNDDERQSGEEETDMVPHLLGRAKLANGNGERGEPKIGDRNIIPRSLPNDKDHLRDIQ
jgi:hypothetical protein